MAEGGTGRAARALTSGPRRSVGAGSARCGVQRGWAERDAARGGAGLVEALRPGPDRAEPRRPGASGGEGELGRSGPAGRERETRAALGRAWVAVGLGFGCEFGFSFSYSSPF